MRLGWLFSLAIHALLLASASVVLRQTVAELAAPVDIVPVEAVIGDVTDIAPIAAPAPIEELAPQPEPEGAPLEAMPEKLELPEIIPDPVAKPKPQRKPKPPEPAPLDLDQLADFIDRSQRQPGRRAAQTSPDAQQGERPRVGLGAGTGLTATAEAKIKSLLAAKMETCWRSSRDATDPERLRVRVRFKLDRSGALLGAPELLTRPGLGDRELLVAAERALAAVRLCAPYDDLPAEYYDNGWDEVTLTFSPEGVR